MLKTKQCRMRLDYTKKIESRGRSKKAFALYKSGIRDIYRKERMKTIKGMAAAQEQKKINRECTIPNSFVCDTKRYVHLPKHIRKGKTYKEIQKLRRKAC